MLLAGPDGDRAGVRYAAGVILTTFVIVVAIVLLGRAISLPTEPQLDATLDLVIGLVLVNVAVLVLVSGRRRSASRSRRGGDDPDASGSRQVRAAFAFGVFAMATNFTTLALMAPAAKEISRTDVEIAAEAVLVLVLVGLVSMPAWVPVALTRVAPGPTPARARCCARSDRSPRSRVHRRAAQRRRAVLHRTRAATAARLMTAAIPRVGRPSHHGQQTAASRLTPAALLRTLESGRARRGRSAALSLSPGRRRAGRCARHARNGRNARASPDADGALALAAERRRTRATGLRGCSPFSRSGVVRSERASGRISGRAEVHAEAHVAGHGEFHIGCSPRVVPSGSGPSEVLQLGNDGVRAPGCVGSVSGPLQAIRALACALVGARDARWVDS